MKLRVGVIGVGKLGRFHCDKYFALKSQFQDLDFVGVFDLASNLKQAVAQDLTQIYGQSVRAFSDLDECAHAVDAVTIAASSHAHFELVDFFLRKKKHVLVEKPLALGFAQGAELVNLAKANQVVLAVGHSERFNPSYLYLKTHLSGQVYSIQFIRHSPYAERVTDVSVVDDLMIHDLDLLSDLCGSQFHVKSASGHKVRSVNLDICDAVLISEKFGYEVFLSAQRLLPNMTRTIRVVTDRMSAVIDLQTNAIELCNWTSHNGLSQITPSQVLPKQDHLLLETAEFLKQIKTGSSQYVSGESVLPSLIWRDDIIKQCQKKMS